MNNLVKRELPYERVLFFSDAIVAIAITLLALDLRLEVPEEHQLTFRDLLTPWRNYLAFVLSFVNIASFWRLHHQMYSYINRMDSRTIGYNTGWLFFIITLPFSTSVLSTHFGDSAAVFLYSLNIFALSVFQNGLWDSSDFKSNYIEEGKLSDVERSRFRVMFNFEIANGLICVLLSFFLPKLSFFLLFFKVPVLIFASVYFSRQRTKKSKIEA